MIKRLLILFFTIIFSLITVFSFNKLSSKAQTASIHDFKVNVTAENSIDIPTEVISSITQSLNSQWQGPYPVDNEFFLPSFRWETNWGIANIYYRAESDSYDNSSSPISNSFTIISAKSLNGEWLSAITSEPLAANIAKLIPEDELSYESKTTLIAHFPSPYKTTNSNIDYKFPWSQTGPKFFFSGVRTKNTYPCPNNSGWHGALPYLGGQRCHAIDFAPRLTATVKNADILSPVTGYIEHLCKNPGTQKQSALAIRATNSNQIIGIWHLDKNSIPGRIKLGELVSQGEYIGRMVEGNVDESKASCPLISYGTHLHLVAPFKPFGIDSYSFTEDSKIVYKGNTYTMSGYQNTDLISTNNGGIVTNPSNCTPPTTGDWVITKNCTLTTSVRVDKNLIVNEGISLTINPNIIIDMNLKDYKILVKNNGKLIINSGAKVY